MLPMGCMVVGDSAIFGENRQGRLLVPGAFFADCAHYKGAGYGWR